MSDITRNEIEEDLKVKFPNLSAESVEIFTGIINDIIRVASIVNNKFPSRTKVKAIVAQMYSLLHLIVMEE